MLLTRANNQFQEKDDKEVGDDDDKEDGDEDSSDEAEETGSEEGDSSDGDESEVVKTFLNSLHVINYNLGCHKYAR